MAFIESPRFPTSISKGTKGGPINSVSEVEVRSGKSYRNVNWDYPLTEFNAVYGVRSIADMYELIKWHNSVSATANEFRFKHHEDYKSCAPDDTPAETDQELGTGNASNQDFQLIKKYMVDDAGAVYQTRKITKPVSGTVIVALDGTPTSAFTVDTTTGIVTMNSPPGVGVVVTAGFEFDVPVHFTMKQLSHSYEAYKARSTNVMLKEVRV